MILDWPLPAYKIAKWNEIVYRCVLNTKEGTSEREREETKCTPFDVHYQGS